MLESRLLTAVRRIVNELIAAAGVPYSFARRYRVVEINADGRLHLQAVRKTAGYPDLLFIQMQPGIAGAKCTPALGSVVLVAFVEGDPTLPVVTHFARPDDGYFVPVSSSLDASGTVRIGEHATLVHLGNGTDDASQAAGRVVCYGDTVSVGNQTGPISTIGPVARVKAK